MTNFKKIPEHIAIIMDGNGRWAKKRNLPRIFGHREGAVSVREITEACAEIGIKYLTLYAFSTENWKRPKSEIKFLMNLLDEYLTKEEKTLIKNDIKLDTIGDVLKLPKNVQIKIKKVKKITRNNKKMTLILALNYGARSEIIRATKRISSMVINNKLKISGIGESTISDNLYTAGYPDPDLLIRTSGEQRVSNFLLWQIAYSELYITDVLWPDFRKKELYRTIREYGKRERRYGGL
ncbi:MAG: isoprenyl transferase [Candidatus Goldbacteria bacterium]|nr:isoprenyl transferase [Candidatus Goldiibacteriota bacterium]